MAYVNTLLREIPRQLILKIVKTYYKRFSVKYSFFGSDRVFCTLPYTVPELTPIKRVKTRDILTWTLFLVQSLYFYHATKIQELSGLQKM